MLFDNHHTRTIIKPLPFYSYFNESIPNILIKLLLGTRLTNDIYHILNNRSKIEK